MEVCLSIDPLPVTRVVWHCGHVVDDQYEDGGAEYDFIPQRCHEKANCASNERAFMRDLHQPSSEQLERLRDIARALLTLKLCKIEPTLRKFAELGVRRHDIEAAEPEVSAKVGALLFCEPSQLDAACDRFFGLSKAARLICLSDEFTFERRDRPFFDYCLAECENWYSVAKERYELLQTAYIELATSQHIVRRPQEGLRTLERIANRHKIPHGCEHEQELLEQELEIYGDPEPRQVSQLCQRLLPGNRSALEALFTQISLRMTLEPNLNLFESRQPPTYNVTTSRLLSMEVVAMMFETTVHLLNNDVKPSRFALKIITHYVDQAKEYAIDRLGMSYVFHSPVEAWLCLIKKACRGGKEDHWLPALQALVDEAERMMDEEGVAFGMWEGLAEQGVCFIRALEGVYMNMLW